MSARPVAAAPAAAAATTELLFGVLVALLVLLRRSGSGSGSGIGLLHLLSSAGEGLALDVVGVAAHVDADDVGLLGSGGFEDRELAMNHVGAHVVALALADAVEQHRLGRVQVDEVQQHVVRVVRGHPDDVAVLALERRARQHHARRPRRQLPQRLLPQQRQPVPPVRVRQRHAVGHLFDVGLRVELEGRDC